MNMSAFKNWQNTITHMCIALMCTTLGFVGIAHAQTSDEITITLQPHCAFGEFDTDWMFGPIPDIEPLVDLGEGNCRSFAVEDPRTLRTNPLSNGDILDIDIVIENKNEIDIQRVRSWLNYDTTVLEGISIEVNDAFRIISPGEEDFDTKDGFVMIDASAENGDEPSVKRLAVARIKFRVIDSPSAGTMISFYNVQPKGHTEILKKSNTESDGISILTSDPGSLRVIFGSDNLDDYNDDDNSNDYLFANGEACQIGSQCQNDNCLNGICENDNPTPLPDGSVCSDNSNCENDRCTNDICTSADDEEILLPNGSSCNNRIECESGSCINGLCQERLTESPPPSDANTPPNNEPQSTAFSLLQVQNFRVTTEANSVFLGWDPLETSRLKAYNIYYGTTTGQYIQRKTIAGTMQSLVLRSLPERTRYYFAIRAVSIADEESAFSNEISVMVGDAVSSTAPLTANIVFDDPATQPPDVTNPIHNGDEIYGETGIPSILVILLFVSSVIGTVFASKRQLIVNTSKLKL